MLISLRAIDCDLACSLCASARRLLAILGDPQNESPRVLQRGVMLQQMGYWLFQRSAAPAVLRHSAAAMASRTVVSTLAVVISQPVTF